MSCRSTHVVVRVQHMCVCVFAGGCGGGTSVMSFNICSRARCVRIRGRTFNVCSRVRSTYVKRSFPVRGFGSNAWLC